MDQDTQIEQLLFNIFAYQPCPDGEKLAAYTMEMLTGMEMLLVRAHVRLCPFCAEDIELLSSGVSEEEEFGPRELVRRLKTAVARFVPSTPKELWSTQHRGSPEDDTTRERESQQLPSRQYQVADVTIDITIVPLAGKSWRITGDVTRPGEPLSERRVVVHASGKRSKSTDTNAYGSFAFDKLPAGHYTLSVTDGNVQIQIRNILLGQ
jgi:hypothetical protein